MQFRQLISALVLSICSAGLVAQATFTVTTTGDAGAGTLRDAITQANSTSGTDTVQFAVTGTVSLLTALPVITENITIDGPGRTLIVIERNSGAATDFRIFETNTAGIVLNINELTIQGGRSTSGAGILSRGPTGLVDVLIQDCVAQGVAGGGGGSGGAIYHTPVVAILALTNCLIENCHAVGGDNSSGGAGGAAGGGIHINFGSVVLLSTTINNCTATGGDSSGGNGNGGWALGGGMYSRWAVTLSDCVVSNCVATGGLKSGTGTNRPVQGGGLSGESPISSIDTTWQNNSVVSNDYAGGGAIDYDAGGGSNDQITITRSVFTGNTVTAGGTNQYASGAAFTANEGVVEIRDSEFSGNIATPSGTGLGTVVNHWSTGGAFLMERTTVAGNTGEAVHTDSSPSADIVNSTISGNTATTGAGGVTNTGSVLSITFSTITLNTGTTSGGIATNGSGTITVTGSIIAQNTCGAAADADYMLSGGSIFDAGGNVIGVEDATTFNNAGTQTGSSTTPLSAMLSVLADNGGLTRTHALQTGSPAIDGGGSTGVPGTDQRNAPRNVGGADSGAFEYGATVPGGQGSAGGEGDSRCSVAAGSSNIWLLLLLTFAIGVSCRYRARYGS
ncbi:MAG: choice-of-anchor Q domain-containing protein [Planctomycetota bacterium]|jgi:hypothetical protein